MLAVHMKWDAGDVLMLRAVLGVDLRWWLCGFYGSRAWSPALRLLFTSFEST